MNVLRHKLPLACAAVLLLGVTVTAVATARPRDGSQAKVVPWSLFMRSGPGTNYRRIGALRKNDTVRVLAHDRSGRWVRVQTSSGGVGWMSAKYLREVSGSRTSSNSRGIRGALEGEPSTARTTRRASSTRDTATTARASAPASTSAGSGRVDTRNLSGLNPGFRRKVENILRRLQAKGWQPYVAEGIRTRAQQREKVRRGYSRTMNSRHLTGNAADIVDRRYGWGGPAANTNHRFWKDLGAAARAEGLTWGGNWRSFKDVAHVQQ